jgi:glyoxylase-like metal-dependent hydrolase (beta-lactamase superfamily II)
LVVDPGGDVDRILTAIDQAGVTVQRVLLTHGHLDHAGGAAELAATLRERAQDQAAVPIEGPDERDRFLLDGIAAQAAGFGFDARNVTPDKWLHEGDAVTLGTHRFDVLHCPGHTPGHIVFVNHAARFALVGDVLFQGSVGRTDFPYGDHAALIGAITSKLLPLGDDLQFLCGHGPGSTIGAERRSNPFLRQ